MKANYATIERVSKWALNHEWILLVDKYYPQHHVQLWATPSGNIVQLEIDGDHVVEPKTTRYSINKNYDCGGMNGAKIL